MSLILKSSWIIKNNIIYFLYKILIYKKETMWKFEMYTDKAGEFRFRLKASNWQNILASEWYTTKAACENGIASVKENSQKEERFDKKETDAGFRFNLKASNWQIIWTSQTYTSADGRDNWVDSVATNAPNAEVVEV